MTDEELIGCLEALLFASGKSVEYKTLEEILEINHEKLLEISLMLKNKLLDNKSGIQLIEINDGLQLATLEVYYEKICKLLDNRPKPSLSQAAMEVLAIMAYNPKITRAEIEKIRGVSSDSAINKLLEYGLIEEAGRLDAPGRPMSFKTSDEFLRLFGYSSLSDMPELPKIVEEDPQIAIQEMSINPEETDVLPDSSDNVDLDDNKANEIPEMPENTENQENN